MAQSYLSARLDQLRQSQNADGGWGYFPGKQSWLEPTVYGALALAGEPASKRAWTLLESWQNPDGSFRPAAEVRLASWGTALCVTLARALGTPPEKTAKAVDWLLNTSGAESAWINRMATRVGLVEPERDVSLLGWPWKPENSAWVEPTSHALLALKKSGIRTAAVHERVRMGQALLLDVRCKDGGWNYGSRAALHIDLNSYPETTGIALVGLQGRAGLDKSLELATKLLEEPVSPMARAWLAIGLRVHGGEMDIAGPDALPPDLQAVALEALATAEGNHRFFKAEAKA